MPPIVLAHLVTTAPARAVDIGRHEVGLMFLGLVVGSVLGPIATAPSWRDQNPGKLEWVRMYLNHHPVRAACPVIGIVLGWLLGWWLWET